MVYKTSISFTTEQAINSLTVKEEDYSEVFYAPFANETTLLTMRFAFSGSDGSYTATLTQIPGTEWDGGANVYASAPGYRPTNMTTIANTGSLIPKNYVYPVNQLYISNNCYYNYQNITSVDLIHTPFVNNSMYNAFYNCQNLKSVTNINDNVKNMSYAFSECSNLVNAPVIPNSVINMSHTFYYCESLENAPVIPNSVVNMAYTFYCCSNITNAPVIPNSVVNMCGTFYCCYLTNAPTIPNSENITNAANCFEGTSLTKNVYIPFKYANDEYTSTYNAFIDAGYKIDGSVDGVYLKDLNQDYVTLSVNPTPSDATVTLTQG